MNSYCVRSLLLSMALVAVSPAAWAQDQKPIEQPKEAAKPADISQLIEQLGDRSYKVRKAAESALRARGQAALEELRKAGAKHADAEVQWRARRLAQELESGESGTLRPRGSQPAPGAQPDSGAMPSPWWTFRQERDGDLQRMFGDIFGQLERDFGVDVPRAHFFSDDFFRGLQEQMEEARRGAMGLPGSGQAFSMRMDQDGVRVEITEKDQDGKSETKVYEAPNLQSFRDKYPEIAERYLRDRGMRVFGLDQRGWPDARPFGRAPFRVDPVPMPDTSDSDNGERLGVFVKDVPETVREFLGLPAGVGLQVQGVNDGSLAATLGIESGDILRYVGDKEVHDTKDVRAALEAIAAGGEVSVKVNRRGVEKVLTAKKPEAKPANKKLEKRADTGTGKGTIR